MTEALDASDEVVDRALAVSARMDAIEDRRAAVAQRRVADMIATRIPKPITAADRAAIAAAQARADKVCTAHSKPSKPPYHGETARAYRLRLLKEWQSYSAKWKDADMSTVDPETFADAEAEIFADAVAATYVPPSGGALYESVHVDRRTGQRIIEFHGRPSDWMSQFQHKRMRVKINRYPNATTPEEK